MSPYQVIILFSEKKKGREIYSFYSLYVLAETADGAEHLAIAEWTKEYSKNPAFEVRHYSAKEISLETLQKLTPHARLEHCLKAH